MVVLAGGAEVTPELLPEEVREHAGEKPAASLHLGTAKREFETRFVTDALTRNDWNITKTATEIGIARKNLQQKIRTLKIERPD
jgi:DNA-binding NtrC family response regulator